MHAIAFALMSTALVGAQAESDLPWWPAAGRAGQLEFEKALNGVPTPESLRAWHDLLGSEPHVAGTPGDHRNIDRLVAAFERLGLTVQRHEFQAYLTEPVDAAVQIVSPLSIALPLIEAPLAEDPDSGHPDLDIGWNAYSANGDVTAEVVYANHGTKKDFERLRELEVDVRGRIAIARYGENFRGYKAKFAEEAGAAGLIIYTDPRDSGYGKGIPYPEGGYANASSIQRGSLVTLANPTDLAPPRIPVQPVGWQAAAEIMSRMRGPGVPEGWQGGLPFAYRLTGGEALRVRLAVNQKRTLRRSANVIATLPGSIDPDRKIIIGCHHDAWGFGAGDPLSGTIVLLECARSFAELARSGMGPNRTIVFAAWGAEEHGIIGSVDWCEANRDDLLANGVAYINLDMASMGPSFRCSAAPTLKQLITAATRSVPQPRAQPARSVFDAWMEGADDDDVAAGGDRPSFGNLGGGSDHVGFYCHLGIPSCGPGGHGGKGVSYHSNYDTLAWYRQVIGDDYEPALMVTRVVNLVAGRLAAAPLLPLDPAQYASDVRSHLDDLRTRAEAADLDADFTGLYRAVEGFEATAAAVQQRLHAAIAADRLAPESLDRINGVLLGLERTWLHEPGLPQRPWFRSLYAATDPDSGYAAWMLPAVRWSIEQGDPSGLADAVKLYVDVFRSLEGSMRAIESVLDQ
jgi:N-acetylated-alpha-linked acidic dipeptidase